jgi:hypothetical protein
MGLIYKDRMLSIFRNITDKKYIYIIDVVVIISSIFLIRFPIALGYRYNFFFRGIGLSPILFALFLNIIYILKNDIKIQIDKKLLLLFSLFLLVWIQAIIRTAFISTIIDALFIIGNLLAIFTLGLFIFVSYYAHQDLDQQMLLRKGVIYACGLYVTLNLVFYFIGIDSHDQLFLTKFPSQMLNLLGVKTYRVLFPMTDGLNNFGSLAGVTLIGHFQLLKSHSTKVEKVLICIVLIACLSAILMTDSRGALLFSIGSIILVSIPKNLFNFLRWSPFIISILPLLLIAYAPGILSNTTSWTNRPSSGWTGNQAAISNGACQEAVEKSAGVLTNRPIIWESINNELKDIKMIQLIGYGYRGQVVSSVSDSYSCLFASYSNPKNASAHNIWLQTILDIGYIGLIICLALLLYLILKLTKLNYMTGHHIYFALLNILLYIILIGSLESPLSPDYFGIYSLVIIITISAIIALPKTSKIPTINQQS